jgi:hypothetical protein
LITSAWVDATFREAPAKRRAGEWLVESALVEDPATTRFLTYHPCPDLA